MKKRSGFIVFLIIMIMVSVVFFDRAFNFSIATKAGTALRPIGIVFENIGESISSFFSNIGNIGKLQKENKELRYSLNKSLEQVASLTEAQKENSALKRDLGFKENNNFELVAAEVVFFDPSNVRDTITINVGKADGINDGDVVISEGFLVGKITSSAEHISKIKLITDPESAIPASITSGSITGIVKGKIGNGLTMEQVPQNELVKDDELVVTSGLGGGFPKGIVLGKVDEVQKVSGSIFQQVSVRPMVEMTKLERVMVIKN